MGYRTKYNGVYTDGFVGYEVTGLSVFPLCRGKCGRSRYSHEISKLHLVGPMKENEVSDVTVQSDKSSIKYEIDVRYFDDLSSHDVISYLHACL